MIGFTLFSAACAVTPNIGMLIAFWALQGGLGALMIPQGFGLLKEVFDDEELGRATRLFGPSTGLAMLGAPIEPSLLSNRMYLSGIAVMLALFGAFGGLLL